MGSLLVHITHGPDAPTRAALGFLVAKTAHDRGHDVTVFCSRDAAYLMKDAVVEHTKGAVGRPRVCRPTAEWRRRTKRW